MADMKNIEDALKALQLAKTLPNLKPLDGQDGRISISAGVAVKDVWE